MPPACRNLWQPRSLVRPVPLNRVFLQSPDIGRIYTRPTLPNESRDVPLDTLHLPRGKHAVCGQSVAGNSAPATAHGEAIPELPGRLVQAPPRPGTHASQQPVQTAVNIAVTPGHHGETHSYR